MPLSPAAAKAKDIRNSDAPKMQHRHFAFIAGVIAEINDDNIRAYVAGRFARKLSITNPNFDVARFYAACGVE